MEPWLIAVIAVCSSAAFILILLFSFALLSYNFAFGKRYDKNPLLKYFTAEDFSLSAEAVEFKVGKTAVRGFIYRKADIKSNGKLVIFVHGMGPGHIAYTTEIAYFCNNGFTVLAVDSIGCNLSDGKNIRGMYAGALTAVGAYDYAKTLPQLAGMRVYFAGHSWGGYSALCASAERKADKVVAISAPDTPVKTIYEGASKVISKPFAAMLRPFWYLINLLKFGAKGNKNAAKCAVNNGTPTLLIHGDNDTIVNRYKAVFYCADGENITKYLAEGKAHNPYNTLNAEKKLAELSSSLTRAAKMTEDERKRFFGNFDFKAATEEDAEVMGKIVDFLA